MNRACEQLEFKSLDEYFDNFVKPNFLLTITDCDLTELELIETSGDNCIDSWKNTKIKDIKTHKVYKVEKMVKEWFHDVGYVLETPSSMHTSTLEYMIRQRSRLDGLAIRLLIFRKQSRSDIVFRFLKPNEEAFPKREVGFTVSLTWL